MDRLGKRPPDHLGIPSNTPELHALIPAAGGPRITAHEQVAAEPTAGVFHDHENVDAPPVTVGSVDSPRRPGPETFIRLPESERIGRLALELSRRERHPALAAYLYRAAVNHTIAAIQEQASPPFDEKNVLEYVHDLTVQLAPHLHTYDLIIGDSAAGRLPALLFRHIINKRRTDLGLTPAATRFANGRPAKNARLSLPPATTDSARALIVIERISEYATSDMISATMPDRDPSRIDIMTMGMTRPQDIQLPEGATLFAPIRNQQHTGTLLYGATVSTSSPTLDRAAVRKARSDIHLAANMLYALLPPQVRLYPR